MKICCCVCTWFRPVQLGQLVKCFLEQDYPAELREMIILDDAGQYENMSSDGWQLISIPRRMRSLGEKRNATLGLVSSDIEAVAIWDDDDIYLPHALSATAAALERAEWSRPSQVLYEQSDGTLSRHATGGLYQGGWGFRLSLLRRLGGYRSTSIDEDQDLVRRLAAERTTEADPLALGFAPFYVYRDASSNSFHSSYMGPCSDAWNILGEQWRHTGPRIATLDVAWPRDYRQVQIRPTA